MKKIVLLAFVMLVSASTVSFAKKDKKQEKKECDKTCCQKAPQTAQDSLSYACGAAVTRGLLPYLQQQMKLDTMYMADFKKGFEEAIARGTDPKFVAYSAGQQIAQQVQNQIFPSISKEFEGSKDSLNREMFYNGFVAGALNDTTVFTVEKADAFHKKFSDAKKETMKAEGEAWLKENAKKEGVVTLPSGLQYKVLTQGTGTVATKDDKVTVRYEGKTIDGNVFDSSYKRNPDTTTFSPGQVIKGWTEALCMMPEGSKWELYIPYNLGYGERGAGQNIKPFATLIFTVEVVKVEKKEEKKAEETKAEPAKTETKTTAKTAKKTSKKK